MRRPLGPTYAKTTATHRYAGPGTLKTCISFVTIDGEPGLSVGGPFM